MFSKGLTVVEVSGYEKFLGPHIPVEETGDCLRSTPPWSGEGGGCRWRLIGGFCILGKTKCR